MKSKYDRHEVTSTTELQAPDMGQAHKDVAGIETFKSVQSAPISCRDNVSTSQRKSKL